MESKAREGLCSPRAREIPSSSPSRDANRYVELLRARRQTDLVAADLIAGSNLESANAGERVTGHAHRNREPSGAGIKLGLNSKILVEGPLRFRSVDHPAHDHVSSSDELEPERNRAAGLLRQGVNMPTLCDLGLQRDRYRASRNDVARLAATDHGPADRTQ